MVKPTINEGPTATLGEILERAEANIAEAAAPARDPAREEAADAHKLSMDILAEIAGASANPARTVSHLAYGLPSMASAVAYKAAAAWEEAAASVRLEEFALGARDGGIAEHTLPAHERRMFEAQIMKETASIQDCKVFAMEALRNATFWNKFFQAVEGAATDICTMMNVATAGGWYVTIANILSGGCTVTRAEAATLVLGTTPGSSNSEIYWPSIRADGNNNFGVQYTIGSVNRPDALLDIKAEFLKETEGITVSSSWAFRRPE